MKDGELATTMQQQEDDEAQKLMEKEQRALTSTPTGKDLLLVQRVISFYHFLQYSIPQNLGVASKLTTLAMYSMLFFPDCLLHLQAVFRVTEKNVTVDVGQHYTNSSPLGMICTNGLMNPTERITNRAAASFSGLPTYDLWSLGCILYRRLFGSPLCNFDCQKINSLLSVFIYHCFHFFAMFMLLLLAFLGIFKNYENI